MSELTTEVMLVGVIIPIAFLFISMYIAQK
jgi:hypothetical protein